MPTCCPISRSATTCSPSTASVTANRATIRRFTRAFKSFAAQKIGVCYLASGHSSGGIIAAWLAANDAERVSACVLEDPPFFRVMPVEMQQEPGCFAWKDGFVVTHAFLR